MAISYPLGVPIVTIRSKVEEFIYPGTDLRLKLTPAGADATWVTAGDTFVKLESVEAVGNVQVGVTTVLDLEIPVLTQPQEWVATLSAKESGSSEKMFAPVVTKRFVVDPNWGGMTQNLALLAGTTIAPVTSNVLTTAVGMSLFALKGEAGTGGTAAPTISQADLTTAMGAI